MVVKMDLIDFKTFEQVITYCYAEKIDVKQDKVLELLLAANRLMYFNAQ
jgi:spore coat polysaccharide biosynthesis protein SpsF (cytidylyltransferase family)